MSGKPVKARLDRPGRRRADGGAVNYKTVAPGVDRSNVPEPSADYIAEGYKRGYYPAFMKLIPRAVDLVGKKLRGAPDTEEIQQQSERHGGRVKRKHGGRLRGVRSDDDIHVDENFAHAAGAKRGGRVPRSGRR